MRYISTRGTAPVLTFEQAMLTGLARDGGLYLPDSIPILTPAQIAAMAAKDAVNRSYETTLAEGLQYERRLFQSLFATDDQTEGMTAFLEKREAQFRDR